MTPATRWKSNFQSSPQFSIRFKQHSAAGHGQSSSGSRLADGMRAICCDSTGPVFQRRLHWKLSILRNTPDGCCSPVAHCQIRKLVTAPHNPTAFKTHTPTATNLLSFRGVTETTDITGALSGAHVNVASVMIATGIAKILQLLRISFVSS